MAPPHLSTSGSSRSWRLLDQVEKYAASSKGGGRGLGGLAASYPNPSPLPPNPPPHPPSSCTRFPGIPVKGCPEIRCRMTEAGRGPGCPELCWAGMGQASSQPTTLDLQKRISRWWWWWWWWWWIDGLMVMMQGRLQPRPPQLCDHMTGEKTFDVKIA